MGIGSNIVIKSLGKQDYHLYANPQITHFKAVFRRHTHFSIDYIKQSWLGEVTPKIQENESEHRIKIKKDGDLLGKMFLDVVISGKSSKKGGYTVNHFGNSLLKKVELLIGGFSIDILHSQWLQIYHELSNDTHINQEASSRKGGLHTEFNFESDIDSKQFSMDDRMIGNVPLVFGGGIRNNDISDAAPSVNKYFKRMFIPLPFWFTKKSGLQLPICALNRHEIELVFTFEKKSNLKNDNEISELDIDNITLITEMIHLSEDEKYRFIQSNHEYIIEQHQHITIEDKLSETADNVDEPKGINELTKIICDISEFKHPVKYLSWAITNPGTGINNRGMGPCYFVSMCSNSLFGNDGNDGKVLFKINGNEKEIILPISYYTRYLPKRFLGRVPKLDRIGFYSFCLNPLDIEPSGTCNFSKLSSVVFDINLGNNNLDTLKNKNVHFFAVNYNLLLITEGMGGLKYN